DLWNGALSSVSGTTWTVNLGAKQAKLFRLGSGTTSAAGPNSQSAWVGSSLTLSTTASGTPPFSYTWSKDGTPLNGQNANTLTLNPVNLSDTGIYTVEVRGGNGSVTNRALLTVQRASLASEVSRTHLTLNWPADLPGWRLQGQTNRSGFGLSTNWSEVPGALGTNRWMIPLEALNGSVFFRLTYP
ncbi:MAG TPA: immunoglobulin domain-containing protein, partial [Bacillota bacterium]|nr:immunoglobulin domain-containing protein [Bacillota bacterium]